VFWETGCTHAFPEHFASYCWPACLYCLVWLKKIFSFYGDFYEKSRGSARIRFKNKLCVNIVLPGCPNVDRNEGVIARGNDIFEPPTRWFCKRKRKSPGNPLLRRQKQLLHCLNLPGSNIFHTLLLLFSLSFPSQGSWSMKCGGMNIKPGWLQMMHIQFPSCFKTWNMKVILSYGTAYYSSSLCLRIILFGCSYFILSFLHHLFSLSTVMRLFQ